jgi:histidine ammonia-lyase
MSINLTGTGLTVDTIVRVARGKVPVTLDPEARKRIEKCRVLLEDKIQKKEIMYGVNTGIGELANVVLTQEQVEEYQRYIIYSHAAGYGRPMPASAATATAIRGCAPSSPRPSSSS